MEISHVFRARAQPLLAVILLLASVTACARPAQAPAATAAQAAKPAQARAIFGGGCFWCMEPPYDALPGVISTTSGYTGGRTLNPTYEQISTGGTGHVEVVEVVFDPSKVSYSQLLDVYWRNVDPVAVNRQFCDVGDHYRSVIFALDDEQMRLAQASKRALQQSGRFNRPIATEVIQASRFYAAEDYHQDYYRKNPVRYKFYRYNCGRDQRLRDIWGPPAG